MSHMHLLAEPEITGFIFETNFCLIIFYQIILLCQPMEAGIPPDFLLVPLFSHSHLHERIAFNY